MNDPVLRDEQPHPIRRAAANLSQVQRFMNAQDRSAEATTLTGILVSLDRTVRLVSGATHVEEYWVEARGLMKHAETVSRLREVIGATRQRGMLPSMREAHDALLEAADKLAQTEKLALPF